MVGVIYWCCFATVLGFTVASIGSEIRDWRARNREVKALSQGDYESKKGPRPLAHRLPALQSGTLRGFYG